MGSISNCGKDENGAYSGGQAGDQTGQEYRLVNWYSRPWSVIYRHPDAKVRATISRLAADAANNDKIGYDQGQRGTFWEELKKVNYEPSKITTPCEADCSSSTSAIIMAAGHLCGVSNLQNIGLPTASSLMSSLSSYGFTKYTGSDYTSSSAKLVAGDIMVMPNHAAIWCDVNAGDTSGDSGGSSGEGSAGGSGQLGSLGIGSYQYQDYTVKKGDTIYSIAKKFNCTPAMIIFINGLDSAEVTAGTTLKVPVASKALSDASSGTNPITKKHTTGILVYHPVIEALFFTEQGLLATVSTTGLTKATDFDNDIISVNTVRDMAQDCPTFTITLVWRRGWYTALSSNDLVIIKMQRPPEKKSTVFFGLIDDIRKVVDFSSGQPQRAVQVTGRGFNKALTTFDVGLLENISIDIGTGFFAGLTELVSMDSYDTIRTVLENYVGRAIKYKFANGKKYEDYFQYDGNRHEGEILTDYENYTDYNGSLWNFIKELTNTPFNETYWEIQDDKPTCIHRRTPFNKEDWIALPRQTIQDLDIVSDNTGRSDLETYTLYTVNPVLGSETLVNYFMPLWYPPFVWKYGITQLTATTAYQSWGSQSYGSGDGTGATGDYGSDVNIRRNIMFSGNGKNSLQYIVLHTSCGPGATAQGIADAVKNQGLSVHGVIDDEGVLQTAEWDVKCAHCGNGNSVSIGFEQTEHKAIHWNSNATTATWSDSDNSAIKAYHDKLYANAVALFAYLGKKYNIPSSNMISHKEIAQKFGGSDHADPEELWDLFKSRFGDSKWTMDAFRANVKKAMESTVNTSGSGWKTTNATSYGNTASDDNGINGWNDYAYHTKSGCMVAIPIYCIKGSSKYNASYVSSDCPEFSQGYGTIVQIVNPANNKSCNAIVADCGSFGPHGSCNRDTLLDLQPNTQKALGFNGGTHQVKYRVIGHWDSDKTNGNGPYNP